jgi:hypothetical protein
MWGSTTSELTKLTKMMSFTTFVFQNGYRLFVTRGVDTLLPEMSRSIMTEGGHDHLRSRERLPHVRQIVAKIVNSIQQKTEVGIRVYPSVLGHEHTMTMPGCMGETVHVGTVLYIETSTRAGRGLYTVCMLI